MKLKNYLSFVLPSLCLLEPVSAAETFRTDINPGLLYWQAFAVLPDLPSEDQKHLFESDWRHGPLDARAGQLALRFDPTFRLLRQASVSTVGCDWGIDLSEGPRVLLPHLAKAKRCAPAAALRARWFVQQHRQDAARDDLVAAFVLGRNLSTMLLSMPCSRGRKRISSLRRRIQRCASGVASCKHRSGSYQLDRVAD